MLRWAGKGTAEAVEETTQAARVRALIRLRHPLGGRWVQQSNTDIENALIENALLR